MIIAGLAEVGCSVLDIGIASTPTCRLRGPATQGGGRNQITASHNPSPVERPQDVQRRWRGPVGGTQAQWYACHRSGSFPAPRMGQPGPRCSRRPTLLPIMARAVLDIVSVANGRPAASRYSSTPTAGGRAARLAAPARPRLRGLTIWLCEPTGRCPRTRTHPRPPHGSAHVGPVERLGRRLRARPRRRSRALIDETNACISEEVTSPSRSKYRLKQQKGPVVINMSTSRMVEDIARESSCECHRSAVGEANVVGRMREHKAVIGGEGNGSVIDPRIGWVRDPFLGMAFILSLMAEEKTVLATRRRVAAATRC